MRSGDGVRQRQTDAVRMLAAVAAIAILAALSGCVGSPPRESPPPSPRPTPLFATDEEALSAATEAYQRYLSVSDSVAQKGWIDPQPLRGVATGSALKADLDSAATFRSRGLHQTGSGSARSISMQGQSPSTVTIYACLDVTGVDIVDAAGQSIVGPSRATNVSVELVFVASGHDLLLRQNEHWDQDLCSS